VLRDATRSLIQIAGLSSVDLRSERVPSASVFYVSARSLCSEGALKLLRQLRSRDIGSALRASHPEVFNGKRPRDESHGYKHQEDSYETRQ
jgi:hypothetical protein